MIKSEGLDAMEDFGYDDNGVIMILGHDKGAKDLIPTNSDKIRTNFPEYTYGLEKVFPG